MAKNTGSKGFNYISPEKGSQTSSSQTINLPDGTEYFGSTRNAPKGSTNTYTDFRNLSPYDRILHTYESSNGYADNSYLIMFQREEFYQERQKYSENSAPAFKQIVDAMIRPVFDKAIIRNTDSALFELFVKNCDATGTSLHKFNETVMTHARLFGVTFVLMENFNEFSGTNTIQELLDLRKIPYITEKIPQQVYKWQCDIHGKLISITFFDRVEDVKVGNKIEKRQYYKRVNTNSFELYYEEINKGVTVTTEVVEEQSIHGFNELPCYPVLGFSKTKSLVNFPEQPLLSLAMSSWNAYNVNSWIMLQGVYQFPIITLPQMNGTTQIALSQNNAIEIPDNAKFAPGFISPSSSCIEVLIKLSDRIEEKIYRQAEQLGVTGTKTSAMASGVSKEWDFRGSNSLLNETALAAFNFEKWCESMFKMYVKQEFKFEVTYPKAFVEAYTNQRLQRIMELLKTPGIPQVIMTQLNKELAKILFCDDQDVLKELIIKIDEEAMQDKEDEDELFKGEYNEEGKKVK